jgi:predicted transglutaminase-like cysteine proteinase
MTSCMPSHPDARTRGIARLRPALGALAVMLWLAGCAGSADSQRRQYGFDRPEEFLTAAYNYERWSQLLAEQREEQVLIDACLADESACPRHLLGYRVIIQRAADHPPERQMRLVNHYFNQRRWRDKRRGEDWQTLGTFLRRGGACEDVAVAKYFALRELGFPADDLRVVIVWDPVNRAHHAVLAVHFDDDVYLLDVDNAMLTGYSHRRYRFLASLNEVSVWDHGAL